MRMELVVAGRNHVAYAEQCIASLLRQDYGDYRITWIDDASEEHLSSEPVAREMLGAPHRIVARTWRHGGLRNVYETMCEVGAARGVVMHLGGDDYLTEPWALSRIASEYSDPECWYVHCGSWTTSGGRGWSERAQHGDFRRHGFGWLPSSWRGELTRKVALDSLQISGWWLPSSGDVALYTPILEMCGLERIRYVEDVLYMYRRHEGNDGAQSQRLQDFCGWVARSGARYSRLARLEDEPVRTAHTLHCGLAFVPDLEHGIAVGCKVEGDRVTIGPTE